MRYLYVIVLSVIICGCKTDKNTELNAQQIVDEAIQVVGGSQIANSLIEFDFRDKHYKAYRKNGLFKLERLFVDSTSVEMSRINDILSNDGFKRLVDEKEIEVVDSLKEKFAASVNSVHYFSVLPFGLNDKAVNKTRLNDITINEQHYYTIQVTFSEEGGGEDFEDVFCYWINKETFTVDYLAYSYNESDGKGVRFRAAYHERYIDDIRFVDYNNYKPKEGEVALIDLPKLFQQEQLDLLSKIELKNIEVN